MNSLWNKLSFWDLHSHQWRGSSHLYRLVGICRRWRQSSWLLGHSETIAALSIGLVFALCPFISSGAIGVLLLACGLLWTLLTVSEDVGVGVTPIHLLVLLYWAIATVAMAFSPVKSAAFSGWVKLTLYLLFFALAARTLKSPRILSGITATVLAIGLLSSAYGVRQQLSGVEQLATWNDPNSPLAQDTRVYSYLGNPNLLAGYLLAAIAFSIAAVFAWQGLLPKTLAVVMVTVNSACLYYTDSRGGWIGMLALVAAFALLLRFWWRDYLPAFWRNWSIPILLGTMVGLLLMAMLFVEPLRLRIASIFVGREDSSNNFRLNVWLAALDMIRDRPWLGIGPGNDAFNKIYPLYMQSKYTALSAYSIFLETAVEVGLIGLGCFLWLICTTFARGLSRLEALRERQHRNGEGFWIMAAIAAMVGMLAHGMVDTVWYRPEIHTLWWLMVAIIASQYEFETKKEEL